MEPIEIVDLSIDDREIIEAVHTKETRKEFNQLRKYIPFLEYIIKQEPKNFICKQLLRWLRNRNIDNVQDKHIKACKVSINNTYTKLKEITVFPPHIVSIFEDEPIIIIYDSDEDPLPSNSSSSQKDIKRESKISEESVDSKGQSSLSGIKKQQDKINKTNHPTTPKDLENKKENSTETTTKANILSTTSLPKIPPKSTINENVLTSSSSCSLPKNVDNKVSFVDKSHRNKVSKNKSQSIIEKDQRKKKKTSHSHVPGIFENKECTPNKIDKITKITSKETKIHPLPQISQNEKSKNATCNDEHSPSKTLKCETNSKHKETTNSKTSASNAIKSPNTNDNLGTQNVLTCINGKLLSVNLPKSGSEDSSEATVPSSEPENKETPTKCKIRDIDNMELDELENVLSELERKTGIKLENVLKELIAKSVEQNDVCSSKNQEQTFDSIKINNNNNNFTPNGYNNKSESIHKHHYHEHTPKTTISPSKSDIESLLPNMKLNDPRIVQKLYQMKDSPLSNSNIQQHATSLLNLYNSKSLKETCTTIPDTLITQKSKRDSKATQKFAKKKQTDKGKKIKNSVTLISTNQNKTHTPKKVSCSTNTEPHRIKLFQEFEKQIVYREPFVVSKESETVESLRIHTPSQPMEKSKDSKKQSSKKSISNHKKGSKHKDATISHQSKSKSNQDVGKTTKERKDEDEGLRNNVNKTRTSSKKRDKKTNKPKHDLTNNQKNESEKHRKNAEPQTSAITKLVPSSQQPASPCPELENNTQTKDHSSSNESVFEYSPKPASPRSKRLSRELKNLHCTFLEYKNLDLNPIRTARIKYKSTDGINIKLQTTQQPTAAPIRRRRQTCIEGLKTAPQPIQRRRQSCFEALNLKSKSLPPLKMTIRRSTSTNEYNIQDIERRISSDGTDEFDINKHHSDLPQLSKAVTIIENTNPKREISKSDQYDVPKISDSSNVDKTMTIATSKICVLCAKESENLTDHYVIKHETESYVSRLSIKDVERLEENLIQAISSCRDNNIMKCIFCQDEVEGSFSEFYNHYASHTGEYGFKCEACEIVQPYKEDIRSHQLRTSMCRKSKIRTLYQYPTSSNLIHLFVCKLCNFAQLNESNVQKHQKNQHGVKQDRSENIKKFVIAALISENVQNVPNRVTLEDNYEAGSIITADNFPLSGEQEFTSECPLDIKDILMAEDNLKTEIPVHFDLDTKTHSLIPGTPDLRGIPGPRSEKNSCFTNPESLLEKLHSSNILEPAASQGPHYKTPTKQVGSEIPKGILKTLTRCLSPELLLEELHVTNVIDSCESPERQHSDKIKETVHEKSVVDKSNLKETTPVNSEVENDLSSLSPESLLEQLHATNEIDNITIIDPAHQTLDAPNKEFESSTSCLSPLNIHTSNILKSLLLEGRDFNDKINQSKSNDIVSETTSANSENPMTRLSPEILLEQLHATNEIDSIGKPDKNIQPARQTPDMNPSIVRSLTVEKPKNEDLTCLEKTIEHRKDSNLGHHTHSPNQQQENDTVMEPVDVKPNITCIEIETTPDKKLRQSMVYRQLDMNSTFFGAFKCMQKDCWFSSNLSEKFKNHMIDHIQQRKIKYLDCSYCHLKCPNVGKLIRHVMARHGMSCFQCPECTYRSMIAGNVIIHRKFFHSNSQNIECIYECGYVKKAIENKLKSIPKKMVENTSSLKCPDCSSRYYALSSLKTHIHDKHPLTFEKFDSLSSNEFTCIHCNEESNCRDIMQTHLALEHPDEPGYVVQRILKHELCEDSVENLRMIDVSMKASPEHIHIPIFEELDEDIKPESSDQNGTAKHTDQEPIPTTELEIPESLDNARMSEGIDRAPDSLNVPRNQGSPLQITSLTTSSVNNVESLPLETQAVTRQNSLEKVMESVEPCISPETVDDPKEAEKNIIENDINSDESLKRQPPTNVNEDSPQQINRTSETLMDTNIPNQLETQLPTEPLSKTSENNKSAESIKLSPLASFGNVSDQTPENYTTTENQDTVFSDTNLSLTDGVRIQYLLEVLTQHTGIADSDLYKCSQCSASFMNYELWLLHIENKHKKEKVVACTHCSQQLELEQMKLHYENHRRHKYVCFHCIKSFSSKEKIGDHFSCCHTEFTSIVQHKLPFKNQCFYFFQNNEEVRPDVTETIQQFICDLNSHLVGKLQQNTSNQWLSGLSSSCLYDLKVPQYLFSERQLYKCLLRSCSFIGSDENDFDYHMNQHTLPRNFTCTLCDFSLQEISWSDIKDHYMLHQSALLHICCVCKFIHHKRTAITQHIENFHNIRDVPVISLWRDSSTFKVSLSIVLPQEKSNFKTCFCCTKKISSMSELISHLQRRHRVKMCPKCEQCDKVLVTKKEEELHSQEHNLKSFKVKYEFQTSFLYNLVVVTTSPLSFAVVLKKEKRGHQDFDASPRKKAKLDDEIIKEENCVKTEVEESVNGHNSGERTGFVRCLNANQLMPDKQYQLIQAPVTGIVDSNISAPSQINLQNCGTPGAAAEMTVLENGSHIQNSRGFSYVTTFPSSSTLTDREQQRHTSRPAPPNIPHTITSYSQANNPNTRISAQAPTLMANYPTCSNITVQSSGTPQQPQSMSCLSFPNRNIAYEFYDPDIPELAPICTYCDLECFDFYALKMHYEALHASKNERFLFSVKRKIECAYCSFRGIWANLKIHHQNFHHGNKLLCRSVSDPTRCGLCNEIFCVQISSASNIQFLPIIPCACPRQVRVLSDCLVPQNLKALKNIGLPAFKYPCILCNESFLNQQQCTQHIFNIHNRNDILPELCETKTLFSCCVCIRTTDDILHMIEHVCMSHAELLCNMGPFENRLTFYNNIHVVYPLGFTVRMGDLIHTYAEDLFKHQIHIYEEKYRISNRH